MRSHFTDAPQIHGPPGHRSTRHALAALVVLVWLTVGDAAQGQAIAPNGPGWAFGSPTGEAALAVAAVASQALHFLPQQKRNWAPYSARPVHRSYGIASDFTGSIIGGSWQITASYGLEATYLSANGYRDAVPRALRATLVDAEAMLFSLGLTGAIKRLAGRCRPRAWKNGRCGSATVPAEHDAFPSGHTAPVAAVAGSRLLLAVRSNGDATARYVAFGLAEGATLVTATLRVLAGAHSWQDVVVGALLGHATGALVALAHPMQTLEPTSSSAATLRYSGDF